MSRALIKSYKKQEPSERLGWEKKYTMAKKMTQGQRIKHNAKMNA